MATPTRDKQKGFDQAKLQSMQEPLSVRVEKLRGSVRQPIELPPKGSEQTGFQPPGTGWSRDEVLQLENFILTKWSGGGVYEFVITDAKSDVMTWNSAWDPRVYPEKIPPNTAEAAFASTPQQQPVAQGGPQMMPNVGQPLGATIQSGWPGINSFSPQFPHTGPIMPPVVPGTQPSPQQPQQAQQAPQQTQWTPPGNYPSPWNPQPQYPQAPFFASPYGLPYGAPPPNPYGYPGYPPYGYPPPQPEQRKSRYSDEDRDALRLRFDQGDVEKRELEQKLKQAEIAQKELEYKATLERMQQQQQAALNQLQQNHASQLQQMQEEIRRMGESRNKGEDADVRQAREEQQRLREQAAEQKAQLERQLMEQRLENERQAAAAQLQMLRDQIERIGSAPKGESDDLRRIREEQDRQARAHETQRIEHERRLEAERNERERERERYERERRDEALQRELKETREAADRRFEQMQLQQQAQNSANNPTIEAMRESARQNVEGMREIMRMQTESSGRMAQFMVSPLQVAQMMKENSTGTDGMIKNIIGSVGEIGSLYKNAAETIMNMSGGGGDPPAARLIQEGLARGTEVAERFLAVKRDQVISESKVKQAEAERDKVKIQTDAALRSQAMHNQQAQYVQAHQPPQAAPQQAQQPRPNGNGGGAPSASQAWSAPPPVVQAQAQAGAGLGGVAVAPTAMPKRPVKPKGPTGPIDLPIEMTAEPVKSNAGPIDHPQQEVIVPGPKTTGPSEEEVFGPALESVKRLRRGVASGAIATPEKCVDAILQGVNYVVTNNMQIPAFALFINEQWADFVDLMIPAAPPEFRVECVRMLIEEVEPTRDPEEDAS